MLCRLLLVLLFRLPLLLVLLCSPLQVPLPLLLVTEEDEAEDDEGPEEDEGPVEEVEGPVAENREGPVEEEDETEGPVADDRVLKEEDEAEDDEGPEEGSPVVYENLMSTNQYNVLFLCFFLGGSDGSSLED